MILSDEKIDNRVNQTDTHPKKPKKDGNPHKQRRLWTKGSSFNKRR